MYSAWKYHTVSGKNNKIPARTTHGLYCRFMNAQCICCCTVLAAPLSLEKSFHQITFPLSAPSTGFWCNNVSLRAKGRREESCVCHLYCKYSKSRGTRIWQIELFCCYWNEPPCLSSYWLIKAEPLTVAQIYYGQCETFYHIHSFHLYCKNGVAAKLNSWNLFAVGTKT